MKTVLQNTFFIWLSRLLVFTGVKHTYRVSPLLILLYFSACLACFSSFSTFYTFKCPRTQWLLFFLLIRTTLDILVIPTFISLAQISLFFFFKFQTYISNCFHDISFWIAVGCYKVKMSKIELLIIFLIPPPHVVFPV